MVTQLVSGRAESDQGAWATMKRVLEVSILLMYWLLLQLTKPSQ